MKTHTQRMLAGALLFTIAAVPASFAEFATGGTAYTKRLETSLLAEPAPLAKSVAKIGYARQLKIEEVRGAWLRVSENGNTGWVFAGNIADKKPSEKTALGDAPLLASETSATAAARPLAPTTVEYGARRGLASAAADLEWVVQESNKQTPEAVTAYLQSAKKGEFAQ